MLQDMKVKHWEKTVLNNRIATQQLDMRGYGAVMIWLAILFVAALPLYYYLGYVWWQRALFTIISLVVCRNVVYLPCCLISLFVKKALLVLFVATNLAFFASIPLYIYVVTFMRSVA